MQLVIKAKSCEIPGELRDYAAKKVEALERYFERILSGSVEFQCSSRKKDLVRSKITLRLPGTLLYAEEKSSDMRSAFDLSFQKLKKRLLKYKGRKQEKGRGLKRAEEGKPVSEKKEEPSLAQVKEFLVERMTVEEAAVHFHNLTQDFFIFQNGETEGINVLYKRKDGSLGLIIPQLNR